MPCGLLYIKGGGAYDKERFVERGLKFEILKDYVKEGLHRQEILDFMLRDFQNTMLGA